MLSIIVAMGKNNIIGFKNEMPWHLPRDLQHFKKTTIHHKIIMGRKTFESIGRALPKRQNIILTRNKEQKPISNVKMIHDIDTILRYHKTHPNEEIFIIGGGTIYKQLLPYVDKMYITYIDHSFKGDSYFPVFNRQEWNMTKKIQGLRDSQNDYTYYFLQYDRMK